MKSKEFISSIPEPPISKLLFTDTKFAFVWLIIRLYVGWTWLTAGWEKITNENGVWVGEKTGVAITGFLNGALEKTGGLHPAVQPFYADFIKGVALPNAEIFSYLVVYGELLVGIGLIVGLVTGIAAFFGAFMNMNYLFAGTVSTNPQMLLLELILMLAWRTAGWFGLDRFALPKLVSSWYKKKG